MLTVLHTGKRWFIICPVAETPLLDDKSTSKSSTAQGMFHVDISDCVILFVMCVCVCIYFKKVQYHLSTVQYDVG